MRAIVMRSTPWSLIHAPKRKGTPLVLRLVPWVAGEDSALAMMEWGMGLYLHFCVVYIGIRGGELRHSAMTVNLNHHFYK